MSKKVNASGVNIERKDTGIDITVSMTIKGNVRGSSVLGDTGAFNNLVVRSSADNDSKMFVLKVLNDKAFTEIKRNYVFDSIYNVDSKHYKITLGFDNVN